MNNKIPCGGCRFFHQQYRYKAGRRTKVWYGYCAKQSVYPVKDADPESVPPVEVTREGDGRTVRLMVVASDGIQPSCVHAESA